MAQPDCFKPKGVPTPDEIEELKRTIREKNMESLVRDGTQRMHWKRRKVLIPEGKEGNR